MIFLLFNFIYNIYIMFSIKESIKYAWEKSKEHMELVLFTTLLILAVGSLTGGFGGNNQNDFSLIGLIAIIFGMIIKIGYNKIFLRIYDGETPKFVDIFKEYKTFWKYLGVSIIYPLVILGGLILTIVPGIIWAVRFSFSSIIVIDTKSGPVAAMKESYAITKGSFWEILLFWITMMLLNILGLIFFGIGLIISIPISVMAYVYVYRKLTKEKAGLIENPSSLIA